MKVKCPYCTNEDKSMLERIYESTTKIYYQCTVCSKKFVTEKEKN